MIPRYSTPEMAAIWTDQARMAAWLDVELAVCEAWAQLGQIPDEAMGEIREKAAFDVDRVNEIEETTQHDVIAFVSCVAENVGECSKYIHYGLTSSDVLDTGLALQLRAAGALLEEETKRLGRILQGRALEHRDTVMIGRTHGVHAEPITFGMVLGLWAFEVQRGLERLQRAVRQVAVGKISGPWAAMPTSIPRWNRSPCPSWTWAWLRSRRRSCSAIATPSSWRLWRCSRRLIEKIALQVRHYQRTEVLEAEEYFAPGQKGSSAMPHKRNPIISERLCGQARVIRGNMLAAFENVALWHERDISHSSAERIILPDSTILLHYMLKKACWLVDKLSVYPENMAANLEKSLGLLYSQRVLLALVEAGMLRDEAYAIVQRSAMKAWEEKTSFRELLEADPEVTERLPASEIEALFDPGYQLRNMGVIFDRVAALEW